MSTEHNHQPYCCCYLELDQGRCPNCPQHAREPDFESPMCEEIGCVLRLDHSPGHIDEDGNAWPTPESSSQIAPSCSKSGSSEDPERWLDLNRLIAVKWGDKVVDPAEVIYVLRETS